MKYFKQQFYLISNLQDESSVQALIDACIQDDDKLYLCVSSPTIKDKPVQIRPWRLSDADFVLDASLPLDPRKTVFVGGVPRPLKAGERRFPQNYKIQKKIAIFIFFSVKSLLFLLQNVPTTITNLCTCDYMI